MPRTILLAAVVALGGCSLTLSGPGADRPRNRAPTCDTGKGLVVLDGIAGAAFGTGALIALGADAGEAALLPAALGIAFVLAAVSGNSKVNGCRAAFAEYDTGRGQPEDDDDAGRRAAVPPGPPGGPLYGPPVAGPPVRPPAAPGPAPTVPSPAPAAPSPAPVAPSPAPTVSSPAPAAPSPAPAAPITAPPAPAPAKPVPARPAPARPAPAPRPVPASDPWVDFWKELP